MFNKFIVGYYFGTFPNGKTCPNIPIWGVKFNDLFLNKDFNNKEPVIKRDVKLNGILSFLLDNILSERQCNELIKICEDLGFRSEAPGITTPPGMRMNKTVHFVASENIMCYIFNRINEHLPIILDGKILYNKLSCRINVYKYDKGDIFNKHIDGDWPGYGLNENNRMVEWENCRSKISMLLYLNDNRNGVIGGTTTLYNKINEEIDINPKQGSALFFRHGFDNDSVLHKGCEILGNTPKYVARINILYEE